MNTSLLRKAAIQSLALMMAVITSSYALKQYHLVLAAASSQYSDEESFNDSSDIPAVTPTPTPTNNTVNTDDTELTGVAAIKNEIDPTILNQLSDNFLIIKKPQGNKLSINLEDIYINKSIRLDISGMTDNKINSDMILRVRGNDMFSGDPVYTEITTTQENEEDGTTQEVITKDFGKDLSQGITITADGDSTAKSYSAQVLVTLDSVYVYSLYEDNNNYYINLRKPSDVYDKIIVIDAGHGGKDGGAISKDDKYFEKNINLGILLQLKELLDKENIKVYYTRTSDSTVFLRPRVSLANAVDADYFVSIHSNANGVSSPNGFEVLYYDNVFKGVKSKDLASIISDEIGKLVPLEDKGIVKKKNQDIFIMDKSQVPTVLIETGYLTNKGDLAYLSKDENKKTIAQGIFNGIMRAYEEIPVNK